MAARCSAPLRLLDEAVGAKGCHTGATVIPLRQFSRPSTELSDLNRSLPIPVSEKGLKREPTFGPTFLHV